ncbi:MAG TPA: PAS domain S-box protein [Thermoanaerobaculia bacterium]|nr:PAS domain S-box protein [Thermoanaerobaculia bacterium]
MSLLLAVLAAVALWFFATFVPDRRRMAIEGWKQELSLRADLRRDLIERRILGASEELTFVAAFPSVRELLKPGLSDEAAGAEAVHLGGILADYRRIHQVRSVWILDPSGRIRASGEGAAPGAAGLALAADVIHSGARGVALGNEPDGVAGLLSAVPVAGDAAGSGRAPILGAVLSVGDASTFLFDLLGQPLPDPSSESLLVGLHGKDLVFLSPLRFRPDPPLSFRLPLATPGLAARAALTERESFQAFVDYRGVRVLAAVRRLEAAPWGLVVKVDENAALAPFRRDVLQRGFAWGALLLAFFGTAVALGRWRESSHEARLARSEARFMDLFEQANDAVFIIGQDRRVRAANRAAEETYGWSREELAGRDVADFRPAGQQEQAIERFAAAEFGHRLVFESEHVRADGSRFPAEVSTRRVDGPDGPVHLSIVRDITARKAAEGRIRKLNRLLRTISEVNQLLVRATDEGSLLGEVCRILVAHGGYALAWIGRADRETMRVEPVASAGDEVGYLRRIEVRWDDTPEGRGPLGTAIRDGHAVIVSDVQTDPLVDVWRREMLRHGFKSLAAIPIRRGGRVTKGLVVYAAEKEIIDEEESALLAELAGDLSFALDALDAREALRLSNAELRKLWRAVEQTPATVVITDLEGRIEYVNPEFTEATGYSADEAIGQNPRFLKSGLTPPEVYRAIWEAVTTGRVWQGELCNRRKDGSLFWERASISPVREEGGTVTHYVAVKEDITERKRAAEALAKSEAYYRSIIENSLDIIAVLDPDGVVGFASPSVADTLGYRPEELVSRSIFELIHPEDRAMVMSRLHELVFAGAAPRKAEVRFAHRDGSWCPLSVVGNRLPDETGMSGVVVNARDLTERLHLEAQIRQAQKMEAVGRLAGGVAHDFNNLLTVIQGYGELLWETLEGDPDNRESVGEIVKAAERAARLTRQLLAFSRRQVLETRVLDLSSIVTDVEKMLKRLLGEDIEIVVVMPRVVGNVKADPGQMEQILLNLAVNARDAMPGGGRLTLALADADLDAPLAAAADLVPAGRYVVLSVTDDGCGMDHETLSHVFEPFYTTKERGKGTGLGLATVYGIVRQTGGYVAVETAPGAGTTFRIYLPRCDEKTTSGVHPAVVSRLGAETVLVVEDEPAVQALAAAILRRRGYTVLVAESGSKALDLVESDPRPIHLILTDLIMPGMNGRELATRMRALRPSIKVVFMSGYAADAAPHLAEIGASGFLPKPFSENALVTKVREVLDTPPA